MQWKTLAYLVRGQVKIYSGFEINGSGQVRKAKTHIVLKQFKSEKGTLSVNVTRMGQRILIDRAMLITFIGIPDVPVGHYCFPEHIDGNIENNSITNLRWLYMKNARSTDAMRRSPKFFGLTSGVVLNRTNIPVEKVSIETGEVLETFQSIIAIPGGNKSTYRKAIIRYPYAYLGHYWRVKAIGEDLPGEIWKAFGKNTMEFSNMGRFRKVYQNGTRYLVEGDQSTIRVNKKLIRVDRVVAHLFLGLEDIHNKQIVVEHLNGNFNDHSVENLLLVSNQAF